MPKPSDTIYQLKITLKGIRPPIWRRFQVPADATLAELHEIIQKTMGWTNSHLHQFVVAGVGYSEPYPEEDWEPERDERQFTLQQLAGIDSRFDYEYDFGDSWTHEILVERVLPAEPGVQYPLCLAGARAGPPEDCGGAGSYPEFLRILDDPLHERHMELLEWIGGWFDPDEFDLDAVNRVLRSPTSGVTNTDVHG